MGGHKYIQNGGCHDELCTLLDGIYYRTPLYLTHINYISKCNLTAYILKYDLMLPYLGWLP